MSNLPAPGVYTVDPVHSNLDFIARHLVASKVRGNFTDFSGEITIGDSLENSSVVATAQAASITTNNEMRDGHLKSADFLELEKYPTLGFKSTKITHKNGATSQIDPHGPARGSSSARIAVTRVVRGIPQTLVPIPVGSGEATAALAGMGR